VLRLPELPCFRLLLLFKWCHRAQATLMASVGFSGSQTSPGRKIGT